MPLPDAEPTPNKANVYEQYSHLTVKEFSQDNYDVTKLPLNLNADSEDVLRRLELIGQVTSQLSSSGAIPGTIQYFPVNGVNNAVSYVDFGPGVWRVMDIVATYTGGSGTITFRAYHYNGVTPLEWYYAGTTSTSLWTFNGDSQFDELSAKRWGGTAECNGGKYLQLGLKPSGTFDADSMTINVVAYKVR